MFKFFILFLVGFILNIPSSVSSPYTTWGPNNLPPFNMLQVTNGSSYSVQSLNALETNIFWNSNSGAAKSLSLKGCSASNKGAVVIVTDQYGDASTNNITITPTSGTINSAATYVINSSGSGGSFVCDGTSNWVLNNNSGAAGMTKKADNATLPDARYNLGPNNACNPVTDEGADPTGVADSSAALINCYAVTLHGAKVGVYIPNGTFKISQNFTVPAGTTTLIADGASFSIDSGKVITWNGAPPQAGWHQIFAGSGTVTGPSTIYPEWFGCVGDYNTTTHTGTDNATCLNAAETALEGALSSDGQQPTLILSNKKYGISSGTWQIKPGPTYFPKIVGGGPGGTRIYKFGANANTAVNVAATYTSSDINRLSYFDVGEFSIINDGGSGANGLEIGTTGKAIDGSIKSRIHDIEINGFDAGGGSNVYEKGWVRMIRWDNVRDKTTATNAINWQFVPDASSFMGDQEFYSMQSEGANNTSQYLLHFYCQNGATIAGMRWVNPTFYYGQVFVDADNNGACGDFWFTDVQSDGLGQVAFILQSNGTSSTTSSIEDVHLEHPYIQGYKVGVRTTSSDGRGVIERIFIDNANVVNATTAAAQIYMGRQISISNMGMRNIGSSTFTTLNDTTVGNTFGIIFTNTDLSGSPITKSYTIAGGDTVGAGAAGLIGVINADVTLSAYGITSTCSDGTSRANHLTPCPDGVVLIVQGGPKNGRSATTELTTTGTAAVSGTPFAVTAVTAIDTGIYGGQLSINGCSLRQLNYQVQYLVRIQSPMYDYSVQNCIGRAAGNAGGSGVAPVPGTGVSDSVGAGNIIGNAAR